MFRKGYYVVFGVLLLLCLIKLRQYQVEPSSEATEATESAWPDDILDEHTNDSSKKGSQGFTLFLLFLLTAVVGGILFVPRLLSMFGDAVGEAVLASGEEVEADPYAEARSLVANGDYSSAVTLFREIGKEHPGDRLPVLEMVKLFQDKMDQPANAILTLESALRQDSDWDDEDKAVFMFKAVDLYHEHTNNKEGAVKMLQQIASSFPKTRHAANAMHQLREIDRAAAATAAATKPNNPGAPSTDGSNKPPKPNA